MERCEPLLLSMLSLTGQAMGGAALMESARKGQSSHVAEFSSAGDLARWRSREVEFSRDGDATRWSSRRVAVLLTLQVLVWSTAFLPTTHRTEGSDAATLH